MLWRIYAATAAHRCLWATSTSSLLFACTTLRALRFFAPSAPLSAAPSTAPNAAYPRAPITRRRRRRRDRHRHLRTHHIRPRHHHHRHLLPPRRSPASLRPPCRPIPPPSASRCRSLRLCLRHRQSCGQHAWAASTCWMWLDPRHSSHSCGSGAISTKAATRPTSQGHSIALPAPCDSHLARLRMNGSSRLCCGVFASRMVQCLTT